MSNSGFISVKAKGIPYPPIDFERATMSGTIPALSKEKKVPLLAHPTCISSTINNISLSVQNLRTSFNHCFSNTQIPPSA